LRSSINPDYDLKETVATDELTMMESAETSMRFWEWKEQFSRTCTQDAGKQELVLVKEN
jgi:hypothetical protein